MKPVEQLAKPHGGNRESTGNRRAAAAPARTRSGADPGLSDEPARRSLCARLHDGDVGVVEEIVAKFATLLARRLQRKFHLAGDEPEGIALDAIYSAWCHRAGFISAKGTLEAWLWRIAERQALTTARAGWSRQRGCESSNARGDFAAARAESADDSVDSVSGCEIPAPLLAAMKVLSRHERAILLADACSPLEIVASSQLAAELRLAAGTVRRYRARARAKMKAELSRLGYANPDAHSHPKRLGRFTSVGWVSTEDGSQRRPRE